MDEVFRALADPTRRRLLDTLRTRGGLTLHELCAGLDMARQSVSKHLAVLEAAGLVTTLRRGREKLHHLDVGPIQSITDRWMSPYVRHRVRVLDGMAAALDPSTREDTVTDTDFVYTTYVRTTPEQLWQALTDPEFTRQYWGVELRSDWRKGSAMTWVENGREITDPEQVVLEADPPRRLAYTWHTFTPGWAEAAGIDADTLAAITAERRSKVSFTLEPVGEQVRLTVVHDDFEPGSTVVTMIREGWPMLLADLKSLLERPA